MLKHQIFGHTRSCLNLALAQVARVWVALGMHQICPAWQARLAATERNGMLKMCKDRHFCTEAHIVQLELNYNPGSVRELFLASQIFASVAIINCLGSP